MSTAGGLSRKRAAEEDPTSERKLQKLGDGTGVAPPASRKAARASGRRRAKEEFNFPVEPRTIVVIKKPRTVMNHSYRDFSIVPPDVKDDQPQEIKNMTFSQKVHHILSTEGYKDYVSWMSHGRAFKVHIPKIFEEQICSRYFGHSRYSSFLRLLNNYGFKHITQGRDRNCYYHECFLRDMPHLCKYMPQPKNARRLIPDPENEPDFYRISELFPLNGETSKPTASEPRPDEKKSPSNSSHNTPAPRALPRAVAPAASALPVRLPTSAVATRQSAPVAVTVQPAAAVQDPVAIANLASEIRNPGLLRIQDNAFGISARSFGRGGLAGGLGRGTARLPLQTSLGQPTLGLGLGTTSQLLRQQQLLSQAAALEQAAMSMGNPVLPAARQKGSHLGLGGFPF